MTNRAFDYAFGPILLLFVGCASSQGDEVRDARMQRINAQTEAKQEAISERAEARSDNIDQRYDTREDRVESSDRPGEDARETLVQIAEQRAQYDSDARARLSKLAARINAAHEKIEVLGARAPLPLKTELETAAKQYDLLKGDVINLQSTQPAKWDETKNDIEHRANLLDQRVSELNQAIEDI